MIQISNEQLTETLGFDQLVPALREAFRGDYTVPLRHHHDFENPKEGKDSTLLLMPAWEAGRYLGVKVVTVAPNNAKYQLPSIHGMYILMDAHKGVPLAWMDARTLTTRRTAAASALASSFLSREDSRSLLMIGTGALAPKLIEAHATVRPIEEIYIWGRNKTKAAAVAKYITENLSFSSSRVHVVESLEENLAKADIISCATLSETPLVLGQHLRNGQHLDMVGAYKPNMREADDEAIWRTRVFVDNYEGATKETGDIAIPLQTGVLQRTAIQADLFELCREEKHGRQSSDEITFFKSVGHALEDLAAAKMAYEHIAR
ncbi:MAG: ornithine cyclodeaminase family protein [Bacteroidota bacterium]